VWIVLGSDERARRINIYNIIGTYYYRYMNLKSLNSRVRNYIPDAVYIKNVNATETCFDIQSN